MQEVAGTRIHQAFVGSCAGGSIEDLRAAATVMRDRTVHPGVRLIATPGSQQVWRQAAEEGVLSDLATAGATVTAPTCGVCFGGMGVLTDGEVCISTSTENMPGRMGSENARIYLASAATVAASAVAGHVAASDLRAVEPA